MIVNIFRQILNNYPFPQEVLTIKSRTFAVNEGHEETSTTVITTIKQKKVIVPMNGKELVDAGLGQYAANETYALYTGTPLKIQSGTLLQKTDVITKGGFDFQIISIEDYKEQGFYRYVITKLMETQLND